MLLVPYVSAYEGLTRPSATRTKLRTMQSQSATIRSRWPGRAQRWHGWTVACGTATTMAVGINSPQFEPIGDCAEGSRSARPATASPSAISRALVIRPDAASKLGHVTNIEPFTW